MNLAFDAMTFAMEKHKDQRRKYTGNPYSDHLAEVAGIVATVNSADFVIATAWLHDCVEDQGVQPEELIDRFGELVCGGVMLLSDLEEGNRETRKRLSRERLSSALGWVQTIKVADMISNTSSIVMHDPKFAEVYLAEKRLMLEVLTKANKQLLDIAWRQVNHPIR